MLCFLKGTKRRSRWHTGVEAIASTSASVPLYLYLGSLWRKNMALQDGGSTLSHDSTFTFGFWNAQDKIHLTVQNISWNWKIINHSKFRNHIQFGVDFLMSCLAERYRKRRNIMRSFEVIDDFKIWLIVYSILLRCYPNWDHCVDDASTTNRSCIVVDKPKLALHVRRRWRLWTLPPYFLYVLLHISMER